MATRLTPILWQLPTEYPSEDRYYMITAQFWMHGRPDLSPILIVASIHTHRGDGTGDHGLYACYIGSPPENICGTNALASFEMVDWVARHGIKLTEREAAGFREVSPAPNGIVVEYRR